MFVLSLISLSTSQFLLILATHTLTPKANSLPVMLKYLAFVTVMSFCALIHAQTTPQMQLSVLDFVQMSVEQLGDIDLYDDKQFVTSVAQLDSKRIGQHRTQESLLKDMFYSTEITYKGVLNILENWNVLILYVDNKLISSDKAESTFSKLFNENRIQNIYIARLHFRETPTNIKGYIRVTTVK